MSVCRRCGAAFSCGMVDGQRDAPCWCTQYPPLPSAARDTSPDATCYCSACLMKLTEDSAASLIDPDEKR